MGVHNFDFGMGVGPEGQKIGAQSTDSCQILGVKELNFCPI